MNVLLDTDVLLDLALDRRPHSVAAVKLINHFQRHPGTGFVAWHTISNFYYMTRPSYGSTDARSFIRDLGKYIHVAKVGHQDMSYALELDLPDFEDAMQVAAAVACRAQFIVSRNTRHYRRSPIPSIKPTEILKKIFAD